MFGRFTDQGRRVLVPVRLGDIPDEAVSLDGQVLV